MTNINHPLVKHCMREEYDIYIGRWNPKVPIQSKWANPFKLTKEEDREIILEKYKEYLLNNDELLLSLSSMSVKPLPKRRGYKRIKF